MDTIQFANASDAHLAKDSYRQSHKRRLLFHLVRFFAAILLVVAALGKAAELAFSSDSGWAPLPSYLLIQLELVLAWVLTRPDAGNRTRFAAVALFSVFAVVGASRLLRSEDDCGCFGLIQIHPGIVIGMDIAVVFALLLSLPIRSIAMHE